MNPQELNQALCFNTHQPPPLINMGKEHHCHLTSPETEVRAVCDFAEVTRYETWVFSLPSTSPKPKLLTMVSQEMLNPCAVSGMLVLLDNKISWEPTSKHHTKVLSVDMETRGAVSRGRTQQHHGNKYPQRQTNQLTHLNKIRVPLRVYQMDGADNVGGQ